MLWSLGEQTYSFQVLLPEARTRMLESWARTVNKNRGMVQAIEIVFKVITTRLSQPQGVSRDLAQAADLVILALSRISGRSGRS